MKKELWATLVTAVLAPVIVALCSSAIAAYYQHENAKPLLTGSILFVSVGTRDEGVGSRKTVQAVSVFVTLENQRDAVVTPVDYLLEVQVGGAWQPTIWRPDYRRHENGLELEFDPKALFYRSNARAIGVIFPSDKSLLTSSIQVPIEKAKPRSGLLTFALPLDVGPITGMRITVVDSSQREYVINRATRAPDPRVILRLDPTVQIVER
ncbi:hypothetical protein LRS03_25985 [Rhizobacter sp. J219]|uniref:hypothetical protein n=1 Tax=Rhizobacter sp. J219 TaxID=2898430 RepID=UPI002151C014|nr:hypothetical protein [Rhizobacter sp. J219]MCR5886116.1 hypothetical protein [Rhizobacter sp. J219]